MSLNSVHALLASNDNASQASNHIAYVLQQKFLEATSELPEVCDGGAACRADIEAEHRGYISAQWMLTLQSIATQLENVVIKTEHIMTNAYRAVEVCDPECPCDSILVEYREVLSLQEEIYDEITVLTTELNLLRDQEIGIIEICPDYYLNEDHDVIYYGETTTITETTTVEGGSSTVYMEGDWEVVDSGENLESVEVTEEYFAI